MPFTTLNLGLTLTIPTLGTRNWGTTIQSTTWTKISNHRHTGSGDGAQMITGSIVDYAVTSAKLAKNIAHYQAAALTPSGTTQTIDFAEGNHQRLNLGSATGTVVVTLSNGQAGARYVILVVQGATPRDITWPASVWWPQGVKPILTGANEKARIELYFDGTNYFGEWELDFR